MTESTRESVKGWDSGNTSKELTLPRPRPVQGIFGIFRWMWNEPVLEFSLIRIGRISKDRYVYCISRPAISDGRNLASSLISSVPGMISWPWTPLVIEGVMLTAIDDDYTLRINI